MRLIIGVRCRVNILVINKACGKTRGKNPFLPNLRQNVLKGFVIQGFKIFFVIYKKSHNTKKSCKGGRGAVVKFTNRIQPNRVRLSVGPLKFKISHTPQETNGKL